MNIFSKERNCHGKRLRKGGGCGERKYRHCISLSEAMENRRYIIRANPDKQTIEMGIAPSSMVFVHKNNINEANLIIGVGETRIIVPRKSADMIKVK
jgi:Fe2+ transport system protein FeoA